MFRMQTQTDSRCRKWSSLGTVRSGCRREVTPWRIEKRWDRDVYCRGFIVGYNLERERILWRRREKDKREVIEKG